MLQPLRGYVCCSSLHKPGRQGSAPKVSVPAWVRAQPLVLSRIAFTTAVSLVARTRRRSAKSKRRASQDVTPSMQRFGPDASPERLASALQHDGCAVLEKLVTGSAMTRALQELSSGRLHPGQRLGPQTMLWRQPLDPVREETAYALCNHPLILAALEIICPIHGQGASRCIPFEVRWLDLEPDAPLMRLHRDQVDATPVPLDRPLQWGLNAIWAATDFTLESGATRMVPGSHSKELPQGSWVGDAADEAERLACTATMPAGSVVLYYASKLHGIGMNLTDSTRSGLNFNYCFVDDAGGRPAGWGW
eukprot:TRINITY_DN26507_c0_g1_i1.p1 TRINITY_DN26507_c0_g1~~TRINITY_DN26507_c0_g1_i1.p1  ORF type:complete len:306 (+),score=56.60 TRINITY_DN26507_c0_g1_i1:20-937(+)